ncbi:hypothetical protein Z043_116609 [Scleropages formosus]|uniref:Uncharacterized protein n=1 Tax=Scleropages formosus TaxID=113540 RepID=A0A0P7U5L4_SCLFO|nr:hypothetical protein Z043_116609 [Scleropages formosus]
MQVHCLSAALSAGQCVLAVPSTSKLSPRFDVSLCRALLGRDGFQIPPEDLQIPLQEALDSPSVRRYLLFSSSVFQFFLAPNKLQRRMSNLRLVVDMPDHDLEERSTQDGGSEETRPLLLESQGRGRRTESHQREMLTKSYSLVPDRSLSSQAKAYRLLLTYSAAYVKLTMSSRLPGRTDSSDCPPESESCHCSVATICLCQYIQNNILG